MRQDTAFLICGSPCKGLQFITNTVNQVCLLLKPSFCFKRVATLQDVSLVTMAIFCKRIVFFCLVYDCKHIVWYAILCLVLCIVQASQRRGMSWIKAWILGYREESQMVREMSLFVLSLFKMISAQQSSNNGKN